ncbi:Hypothetical predicted protein [Podarcis lilfordi]|uniref:Uncharacterized protein n=1 Tax=Podarcis lilfordi TaxID=74358 RepID=A0AA35P9F6_9SAUR|nr:Hypothetical predicted protein [Podarcis lilfordi]
MRVSECDVTYLVSCKLYLDYSVLCFLFPPMHLPSPPPLPFPGRKKKCMSYPSILILVSLLNRWEEGSFEPGSDITTRFPKSRNILKPFTPLTQGWGWRVVH